jgi:hypothetical protein
MVIKIKTVAVVAVTIMTALTFMVSTTTALADSSGNNGQCIQLQKTFPPELQYFEGCHDTFTEPGHNEPPPLPNSNTIHIVASAVNAFPSLY